MSYWNLHIKTLENLLEILLQPLPVEIISWESRYQHSRNTSTTYQEGRKPLNTVSTTFSVDLDATVSLLFDDNYYTADVVAANDYYPGGSLQPGRSFNANSYRYSYQGSEKDDEIAGSGNHITTYFRENDTRLLRWWSTDPKASAGWSPYASMQGNPILWNDVLGDSIRVPKNLFNESKAGEEGYNSEGLNEQDWVTFRDGIYDVSGITLETPSLGDKNLSIGSIDDKIGSNGARSHFKFILNSRSKHQAVEISNNDPNVLGAHNLSAAAFDPETGNYVGTIYNQGNMLIDLADIRKWKETNSKYEKTTDSRALGLGFIFLHENLHNIGIGLMPGISRADYNKTDQESPVIQKVNVMRNEMGLPSRDGHKRMTDKKGGYLLFDDKSKYYIN